MRLSISTERKERVHGSHLTAQAPLVGNFERISCKRRDRADSRQINALSSHRARPDATLSYLAIRGSDSHSQCEPFKLDAHCRVRFGESPCALARLTSSVGRPISKLSCSHPKPSRAFLPRLAIPLSHSFRKATASTLLLCRSSTC